MKIKSRTIFIITFTILILVVLGTIYYKTVPNIQQENIHYTDILILKNKYPHKVNSFTQGLFFYNNQMYESIRTIWEISVV